jgi:uncharacterized membrane protein
MTDERGQAGAGRRRRSTRGHEPYAGRSGGRRRRAAAALAVALSAGVIAPGAGPAEAAGTPPPTAAVAIIANGIAHDVNATGVVVGYADVDGQAQAFRGRAGPPTLLGPGVAHAVNDAGHAVGRSGDRAVRWAPDGSVHVVATGTLAASALDIDSGGTVVGSITALEAGTPSGAFVRAPGDPAPRMLPPPAGYDPEGVAMDAWAINDRGTIVGTMRGGPGSEVGVVWQGPDHTATLLPGSTDHVIIGGVNDHGVIVGTSWEYPYFRPLRWASPASAPEPIGGPGLDALARDVNDRGLVAGSMAATGRSFTWDPRTGRTTPVPGLDGSPWADVWAINDRGTTAGHSTHGDPPITYATRFPPPGAG